MGELLDSEQAPQQGSNARLSVEREQMTADVGRLANARFSETRFSVEREQLTADVNRLSNARFSEIERAIDAARLTEGVQTSSAELATPVSIADSDAAARMASRALSGGSDRFKVSLLEEDS